MTPNSSHRTPAAAAAALALLGALAPLALAPASIAREQALAARTLALRDSGRLHLTSKHGFVLNEQGSASGSVAGAIYVHLTIVSTSRVTAELSIYPRGGSITGYATASYRRGASAGTFAGSMRVLRGTGSYANARATGLSFSGTIQRSNQAIAVYVSGDVSD